MRAVVSSFALIAFGLSGVADGRLVSNPRIWALTEHGLYGSGGQYMVLPLAFPPTGAVAHRRAVFTIETSTGVGRRVRFHADVVSAKGAIRRYDIGHTQPTAPPVFDAHDEVVYAMGTRIHWLDGRIRSITGLPRGSVITQLEFAPRGGDVAVTANWGVVSPQDVGSEALYVVSAKKTRLVASNFAPAAEVADPVWNPAGTWLAYERQVSGQDGIIYAVRAIGGTERRISRVKGAFNPIWSHDGKEIAFTAASYYTRSAIYVWHLDSGRELRLTRPALDRIAGAFSPDDRSIALTSGHTIATVSIHAGRVRVLARFPHREPLGRARMLWLP